MTPRLDEDAVKFVRRVVLRGRPQSITEAKGRLGGVADLVAFHVAQGRHVRPASSIEFLFSDTSLAAWKQALQTRVRAGELTQGTAQTHFSQVRRLGVTLDMPGDYLNQPGHTTRLAQTPPMTDQDFAEWERIADAQTGLITARFKGLLYCCRGAGLGSEDIRFVRGEHVVRRRDGATVISVQGRSPRVATVLDRYAEQLLKVAARFRDEPLVGVWPHRQNPVSDLVDHVLGGQNLRRPMPRQLRRAYVVEMLCTNVPVIVLKQQLGKLSLSEIDSAIPFALPRLLDESQLRQGAAPGQVVLLDRSALRAGTPVTL